MEEILKEIDRLTKKKEFFVEQIKQVDQEIIDLIKSNNG